MACTIHARDEFAVHFNGDLLGREREVLDELIDSHGVGDLRGASIQDDLQGVVERNAGSANIIPELRAVSHTAPPEGSLPPHA